MLSLPQIYTGASIAMRMVLLIILCCLQSAFAQERERLFSTIDVSGGILINSNRNLIHQYWEPGKGYFISAGTPFYFGKVEAGLLYIPFIKTVDDVPDFDNYFIFMGLSSEIHLPFNLSITGGIRFGSDFFRFSDDTLSSYDAIESELGFDLFAAGKLKLYRGFFVNVNADYLGILTHRTIRLLFLSAGLGYEFSTPLWLKEFLK